MPSYPIEYKDIEGVITGWKLHESPYWSLWSGTTLKCVCAKDSTEESEDLLREQLEAIEASGYEGVWKLQIHEDAKKLTSKKDYKGSFNFQLNERGVMGAAQAPGSAPNLFVLPNNHRRDNEQQTGLMAILTKMAESQEQINQRLAKLEAEEEEYDEEDDIEEETPEQKIERSIGYVKGIIEPFQPLIMAIVEKLAGGTKQQEQKSDYIPENIGDMGQATMTPEQANERLHAAITALEQKIGGDKLVQALEKLAAMDTVKLKGMLMML